MTGRLQLCLAGVLCVLAVGISCWLCLPPAACAGKTTLIEQVDVQVRAEKNLPEPVRQRMEKSVAVIAGQLLEGRKLTEVGQARADYAGIIQQVFDKVLGFLRSTNATRKATVQLEKQAAELMEQAKKAE